MLTALMLVAAMAAPSYDRLTCYAAQDTLNGTTAVTFTFHSACYGFEIYNWSAGAILVSIDGSTYPVRIEQYGDTGGFFMCPQPFMQQTSWSTIKLKGVGTNAGYVSIVSWCD